MQQFDGLERHCVHDFNQLVFKHLNRFHGFFSENCFDDFVSKEIIVVQNLNNFLNNVISISSRGTAQ